VRDFTFGRRGVPLLVHFGPTETIGSLRRCIPFVYHGSTPQFSILEDWDMHPGRNVYYCLLKNQRVQMCEVNIAH
jgi:hypothetical protein